MAPTIPAPDHTITVAIGDPDRATLDAMVREVAEALRATVGVVGGVVETHHGNGSWRGEPEHSAHVTTYPAFGTAHAMRALSGRLADTARRYGQESIAVWGSPATMVSPA